MDYKQLVIRGISYSQTQSGAYALLLEHEETNVKLPVVIGNFEAQSISLGLEKDIHPPRPLTHDLFSKFVTGANFSMVSVIIYQILDGVFFSNIIFRHNDSDEELTLDARTSDAVAMAVRFDAPIFATSQVLNEAGILLDIEEKTTDDEDQHAPTVETGIMDMSTEELQKSLDNAVREEDYDTAMEIQEELKRRRKKID